MSLLTRPSAAGDALVLRAWPCGETSAVASLLVRELGFVKVLAKGARQPRSRLRALVEPGRLVNVEFGLDPARELQYLRGGGVVLDPMAEGATLERSAYLLGALELVDRCRPAAAGPGGPGEELLFGVCERFVGMLSSPACREPALLFFALEWRLLDRHGTAPQVDRCSCCGADTAGGEAGGAWFQPAEGGLVCGRCTAAGAAAGARPVDPPTLALLRRLGAGDLAAAAAAGADPGVRREAGVLLHRFLGYHLPGYRLPAALDLLRAGKDRTG
ncbi:MAG: DNA repair protein RecO [Candidatus Krumholzibacteriia bacterium]